MSNVFLEENVLTEIGNAIRSKTGKEDMILPKNMPNEIKNIETGGDNELLNKVINKTVTDIFIDTNIGAYAFFDCSKINPTFGDNCNRIGALAFQNCGGIVEINTNKVTVIDSNAFIGCNLVKIVLPNILDLNNGAFARCKNLISVIISNNKICTLKHVAVFLDTPIAQGTGYIYVPKSLIEQYKVETNWVTYANQFRAIEDYPEVVGEV